ncbi:MAG: DNA cytosine methyltransferase [Solirubrobacterales bacterium]
MSGGTAVKARLYAARGTDAPWYKGWDLSDDERERFRRISMASQAAKARAMNGECDLPKHPIPTPRLDPCSLMPQLLPNGLRALSLFSGGGGLDIGFDRAGYEHVASYDILPQAAEVLNAARPQWTVYAGDAGDVTVADWTKYRGMIDVLHGGPPCQPFSHAGSRKGAADVRDMIPELVRAVLEARPRAFLCENVSGLATKKFAQYIQFAIFDALKGRYHVRMFTLEAADFGVPQRRKRVFFVGFQDKKDFGRFAEPLPTHRQGEEGGSNLPQTMGAREALGLPDIGADGLAPTLRSGLTGPRHSTSVVNSMTAMRDWNALHIWPNGVAADREAASQFVAKNGDFRLSIADCMVLQGFPADWPIKPPVYKALGLIGNSVAPPMGYAVAVALAKALT